MDSERQFAFIDTQATQKVFSLTKRIRAVAGGTSASKTISILVWLIDYCQSTKNELCSVVSESYPHLEKGAMLDFENIMKDRGYWKDDRWHGTKHIYTFETGSKLEFYSPDTYGKAHGPRRDVLFINEANNLDYKIVDQLIVRTRKVIWFDWNPTSDFWFYTDFYPNRQVDTDFITLTYKDNEALDETTIQEIESHKGNKNWWTVYGLGQLGTIEGRIYKDWQVIETVPHEARLERRGLDFGYSNDPTAIVDIYYYNGGYILDEQCYRKGLLNSAIAGLLANYPNPETIVVADSAEPKSIDEIKLYEINILPAVKGQNSIKTGIQFVQAQRISVTARSINLLKEYRNYMWQTDKDGRILNEPEQGLDHCFAPETLIYTTNGKKRIDELVGQTGYLYSRGGKIERFSNVRITKRNVEMVNLTFDDNQILSVTLDHLLLQPNGEWIEASLLRPMDVIQSVMYGSKDNIQNKTSILQYSLLFNRKVFSQFFFKIKKFASYCLGISFWRNPYKLSYSSQGYESSEQSSRKFGVETQISSFVRSYDFREKRKSEAMDKKNQSFGKEVAWIKRGDRVAQITWQKDLQKPKTYFKELCALPQRLYDFTVCKKCKILPFELQNESPTKKIIGITRGFAPITYNLEVENTNCLWANGVVAHNCMDAIRYALNSILAPAQYEQAATVIYHDI